MEYYLNQVYTYLNTDQNQMVIMTVFLCLALAAVILRMITCSAYRTSLFAFRLNAKDIRTRDEIAKLRFTMLRTLAAEYIRISDKNVSRIPTEALIRKQLSSISLMGWRFISVMTFVESLETGLLLIGLVLAVVFQEQVFLYGTMAAGGFLLFRFVAALFDFRSAYSILANDLLIYVEREIGQFYSADSGGAVMKLKNELIDVIARQTVGLQESINKLGGALANAVDKKLADMNDSLKKAMDDWERAIASASSVQTNINEASEHMLSAIAQLTAVSQNLADELKGNNESVSGKLAALTEATAAFSAEQDAFLSQAKLIERNQHILESTYQSYEMTLQNLTQSLGDGLGAYLKMHAQTASQAVSDAMTANIEKMSQLIALGSKQSGRQND